MCVVVLVSYLNQVESPAPDAGNPRTFKKSMVDVLQSSIGATLTFLTDVRVRVHGKFLGVGRARPI